MKNKSQVRKTHTTKDGKIQSESRPKRFVRWEYVDEFQRDVVILSKSSDGRIQLAMDANKHLYVWFLGGHGDKAEIEQVDYERALQFLLSHVDQIIPLTPERFLRLHGILPPAATSAAAQPEPPEAGKIDPMVVLESAVKASVALAQLLSDSVQWQRTGEKGCYRFPQFYEGIECLQSVISEHLEAAAKQIEDELGELGLALNAAKRG